MQKPQALLIHSLNSPVGPIQKLLEERGFQIHFSRGWDEWDRIQSALPLENLQYIFADVSQCQGSTWEHLTRGGALAAAGAVLVCYNPQYPQTLYSLFEQPSGNSGGKSGGDSELPLVIGETPRFREVLDLATRYATHDITVLITGETGTGKEVIARYIHASSKRKDKPFVACNMTAIPETLVESELFGYVRGAFTGADRNKKGLIEAAEGGTLFLDEIGDLAPAIQLKLLRFLESREFYKVGESVARTADVRIIAATNKELDRAILEDGFRKDLFYRLNSARIILPPLRERKEDIILLVANFVYLACRRINKPIKKLSTTAKVLFVDYPWPGNIRELKNVVESAVMVADGEYVTLTDLPMHLQQYATSHREEIGAKAIRDISDAEQEIIEEALKQANGNKAKAAEMLGISTRTLYRKLVRFANRGD
ncbi:MAG TPA: sigma 54-interacting transcriptional regulator [Candidatus Acidoferrales bacterium]|nr:sigma 54-interacting transcriptional regulator [Candidatus Acidoferrales bacterium]